MAAITTLSSTCTIVHAAAHQWGALIIGAGPAGAMAAHELARLGRRVLLIDRSQFPRDKVCGCCLNAAALHSLRQAGLERILDEVGAPRLTGIRLASAGRSATFQLREGAAISRRALDAALIGEAIAAGADFLPGARAREFRTCASTAHVDVETSEGVTTIAAEVVIAADGLSGDFLRRVPGVHIAKAADARIGASARLRCDAPFYQPHCIYMSVAAGGYVGVVCLEDGAFDVAAAFDRAFVRDAPGLAHAARSVLSASGLPLLPGIEQARWRGTPELTRYARSDLPRLLLIGDSAGYVEPFTGEGMACALASGMLVARAIASAAPADWRAAQHAWRQAHHKYIQPRHRRCRRLTHLLRYPRLVRAGMRALACAPVLAQPMLRALNRPFL